MAIQPIDLQTIFSQLDKVGRTQSALREGQQIQASIQQGETQRKIETEKQSVNEAQNMGEEANKIRDENKQGNHPGGNQFGESSSDDDDDLEQNTSNKPAPYRDLSLGRNIDISG